MHVLRADHLAAALDYESAPDDSIRSAAGHNHSPRVALFEAAVRFAIAKVPPAPGNPKSRARLVFLLDL